MICKLTMMTGEAKSAAPLQWLLYASEDQVAKQQHDNNQSFSCPNRHARIELNCRNMSLETVTESGYRCNTFAEAVSYGGICH